MSHCATCRHYTPKPHYEGFGSCALIVDVNDCDEGGMNKRLAYSWDYEGYSSGNYVGEAFGCIHFERQP